MATKQQEKQAVTEDKQECQQRCKLIGKRVLDTLGQPAALYRVQVCHLWDEHYRVNVLVVRGCGLSKGCAQLFPADRRRREHRRRHSADHETLLESLKYWGQARRRL